MAKQIIINSLDQLKQLTKQKHKLNANERICPVCQHKQFRIFIKGVEKWMGCKCSKIKAHHYI